MTRFIFVLWCLIVFSASIFGQTLDADLKNSFNKYSVVKIDDQEALKKAKNQQPFMFKANDKTFQFILTPNEIRSENYKAEYTDKDGRHSLPKSEVFTYKGTLIGEKDSVLAFTVDGRVTEGFFLIGRDAYYLESAKKYSSKASNDDKVVYQTKDKIKKDNSVCGLDDAIARQLNRIDVSASSTIMSSPQWDGIKVIELATDADYQWVTKPQFGGNSQAAKDYILSVLNGVDVIYRHDLKLTIKVTYQNVWTTPDTYRSGNMDDTLADFKDYWNTNFSGIPRDLAHLFTGKYDSTGDSYPGVVCISPHLGYGLSGYINFGEPQASLDAQTALAAHEIGHNIGASHVDNSGDCTNTIMNPTVSNLDKSFCAASISQITNFITNNGACLALEVPPPTPPRTLYDFDGDGKADISMFRPSTVTWYIQGSKVGFYTYPFGNATDKLAPADYDNDGKTDIAVFRPTDGYWYWINSSNGTFKAVQFGASGDIPVPGDFTGDRQAELVVFRPSNGSWYTLDLTNNQVGAVQFGQNGDKPVMGDFDGDGKNDYAVFRVDTWYILRSTQGLLVVQFGVASDLPVPADYDGDHKTDIAVFRPSSNGTSNGTWYLQKSTEGFSAVQFGAAGDKPTPADYDGDGRADISVFRPSDSNWYRINSSTNAFVAVFFGNYDDIPIPGFNVVQ